LLSPLSFEILLTILVIQNIFIKIIYFGMVCFITK
jgi:hypothetical protein